MDWRLLFRNDPSPLVRGKAFDVQRCFISDPPRRIGNERFPMELAKCRYREVCSKIRETFREVTSIESQFLVVTRWDDE